CPNSGSASSPATSTKPPTAAASRSSSTARRCCGPAPRPRPRSSRPAARPGKPSYFTPPRRRPVRVPRMASARDRIELPPQITACLFDLDGVLTKTAVVHAHAWKQMFDEFLKKRAEQTGEAFREFDIGTDYNEY